MKDKCIAPYLPREGPETYQVLIDTFLPTCIDTYLPREGPETRSQLLILFLQMCLYSYLSTSRGAGNAKSIVNSFSSNVFV